MSDATLANDYHFLEDVIGKINANQRFLRQSGGGGGGGNPQHSKRPRHQSWTGEPLGEQHALLQAARKDGIASKRLILPMGEDFKTLQPHDNFPAEEVAPATITATTDNQQQHLPTSEMNRGGGGPSPAPAAAAPVQRQMGLSNLQNHARQRGITLLRLPPFMERHQRNETCVRNKLIYWTVEWRIYPNSHPIDTGTSPAAIGGAKNGASDAQTTVTTTTTSKVVAQTCETVVLWDELRRLVVETVDEHQLARHSLLLKHELSPANAPKYVMVSSSSSTTLADALADQTIIEFPTFHVVPPARLKDFPLLIQSITGLNEE
jgi:hypothetical protein